MTTTVASAAAAEATAAVPVEPKGKGEGTYSHLYYAGLGGRQAALTRISAGGEHSSCKGRSPYIYIYFTIR